MAGASERDIEWAVQNARVVLQAMQMRAGQVSRDRSMADNVKWSASLDATLAASRLPLFALDLRAAPEWFHQAHGSRQIGAIYPDGEPYAFIGDIVAPEAYDAVLFVETTRVARKNPGR